MAITTILGLPAQPLPAAGSEIGGIVASIWLFGCVSATVAFYLLLKRKSRTTWPEFKPVFIGTIFLSLWYLVIVFDRWFHYAKIPVVYGYIFVLPISEILRIASTVYYLWGTYIVIWRELEDRFPERQQGYWWFVARCSIFIVGLISTYYVSLFIAQVAVWVQFLSLNTIADVATKRTGFEIAMTTFFFVFGLITLAAACASLLWKAREMDGKIPRNRIYLLLATLFLLIRSLFEFALTVRAWGPYSTRQSLQPIKDIGYGIITLIYLTLMYGAAYVVSSEFDQDGREARLVKSDIRVAVLSRLKQETDEGRRDSPPFGSILDKIESDLDTVLRDGPLSCNLGMSPVHKDQIAKAYVQDIRKQYGNLDPREGKDSDLSRLRNFSSVSTLLGLGSNMRRSANQFMQDNLRRASNQSMHQVTEPALSASPVQHESLRVNRLGTVLSSQSSRPSRWAPSVSEYTDTVASARPTPLDQRPFRERMGFPQ